METIAIKAKKPFDLQRLKEILSHDWGVEDSPDNTLVVHGATSRAYLVLDPKLNGPEEFRLQIDYSDVEFVKGLLEKIANDSTVTIDNDFGTLLPGSEFVARCKTERGWDWRQQVPPRPFGNEGEGNTTRQP